MKQFFYETCIFDTASDADLSVFPKVMPFAVIAENETEAQRQIVDTLFDPREGVLGTRMREDDSADRFHIVFHEPEFTREVDWDPELGVWNYADEEVPPEERERQKAWLEKNLVKGQGL